MCVLDIIDNIEANLGKFITKYQKLQKEKLILEQENNDLSKALKSKEEDVLRHKLVKTIIVLISQSHLNK